MTFEDDLKENLFKRNEEKSFIDKMLARREVDEIREIIKKKELSREDILDLLYMLSSNESKLLNFSEWDRYVILKYFVWIRDFVKIVEGLYDYKDDLSKAEYNLTPETVQILNNNDRLLSHNTKFLVDLYFNICRTTLSIGATGIMELLKNKFEVSYPQGAGVSTPTPQMNQNIFHKAK